LPDRSVIVDILRHHIQHLRKARQRDKRRIESLFLRRIGELSTRQPRVLLQPVIDIQDFLRIRRRGSDLRQQRIRVERDRSQQLIQLLRRRRRRLRREYWAKILGDQHGDD